jgi:hypothetical protein
MNAAVILLALTLAHPSQGRTLSKTEPPTWSKGGAFNVRWGMGPGDVKVVHPGITFFNDWGPISGYWMDDHVEGVQVKVMFVFFEGRLHEIEVTQSIPGHPSKPELQEYEQEEERWVKRVRPILVHKYGVPRETVLRRGYAEMQAWVWKHETTEVVLHSGPGASLKYADLDVAVAVDSAKRGWSEGQLKAERDRL